MRFQIVAHDTESGRKTVFETTKKSVILDLGKDELQISLDEGGVRLTLNSGGQLVVIPRVSNSIVVKPEKED